MSTEFVKKSIIDNNNELKSYLSDMNLWEKDAKSQDAKYQKMSMYESDLTLPPPRNIPVIRDKSNKKGKSEKRKSEVAKPKSYADWDKFDVNKALQSDSDEEEVSNVSEEKIITDISANESSQLTNGNKEISDNKNKRANQLKEEGNKCYSRGEYSEAVAKYTRALPLDPKNPIIPANRAMAYIKLGEYAAAEMDCNRCLKLDPVYIKALLRRATARQHLNDKKQAAEDYKKVLELEPWNKDAKKEFDKLRNELNIVKKIPDDISQNKEAVTKSIDNRKSSEEISSTPTVNKKIKIAEVNSKNEESAIDPNIVLPINKPQHLRSKNMLVRVPVTEVKTIAKMEELLNKRIQPDSDVVEKAKKPAPKPVEVTVISQVTEALQSVTCPSIPPVPNTSHRFLLDWNKIKKFPSVARDYILLIPSESFKNYELDADILSDIFLLLNSEIVSTNDASRCILNLIKSREFDINLAFMDDEQKSTLSNLVLSLQNAGVGVDELKKFILTK